MSMFSLGRIAIGVVVLGMALAALSFSPPDGFRLKELSWLLGTWERESAKSVTYESWRRLSDRTFEGESHRIARATGDTVFTEYLLLVEMGGEIFYIPKVAENEYPVPFKLTSFGNDRVVFDNPGHDFPQRITYQRNADGSLTALTEGNVEGENRQIVFQFSRVK